jgi:hypothetical protein
LQMDAVICCSLLHTSVLDCSGISTLRKMDPLRNVTVTVAASVMPGPAPSAAPVWPCSDGERGTGPIRAVWCLRRLTGHRGGHWGQLAGIGDGPLPSTLGTGQWVASTQGHGQGEARSGVDPCQCAAPGNACHTGPLHGAAWCTLPLHRSFGVPSHAAVFR